MSSLMKAGILPVLAAVAVLADAIPATAKYDMKIGYPTTKDPQHDVALRFAKLVKERTNGEVVGRVFPTSQLGVIARQVEGIQLGTQEVFMAPPGFLQGVNPAFQVVDAPGVFRSRQHMHRSITDPGFRDRFLMLGESKGIIGAQLWVYDGNSYMTMKPIKKIEDLEGLKIRVLATEMEQEIVATFGATGVPIPFSEVMPALQQRIVDGARTSLVVAQRAKFGSIIKNVTIENGTYIPSATWFSKAWLEKLPQNHRKVVLDTAKELEDWASNNAASYVPKSIEAWKREGATIHRFSKEERKQYVERIAPLGEELLANSDEPEVREMYKLLKEAAKRNLRKAM